MIGKLNGAIKHCSAVIQAKKAVVAILFNNNFNFQIQKSYSDPGGRFIICDLTTNGKHFTLANIYAPNEDDPNFFADVSYHLLDFKCDEIVIGGDFNLVLDVEKDKKGGLARTHKKSLEVVKDLRESLDLIDAWTVLHPDLLKFTWRQRRPEVHCRLDFFLVSQSAFCNTIDAKIIPGYKTDHSMITITVSLHSNNRGQGFWKLNTSLLEDTEYVALIKSVIQQTKDKYTKDEKIDPNLLWEMVKMKIREHSMWFGAFKKRKMAEEQEEIERSISALEKRIIDGVTLTILRRKGSGQNFKLGNVN